MKKRYVLLDRDGTLIADRHYLGDPAGVELLPRVAMGLRKLQSLGLGLIIVTNQSGVGREYFDLAAVDAVNARMAELLEAEGIHLDAICVCPHHPEDGCECRKPRAGLVLSAARRFGFNPADCVVIGDQLCDIELGRVVGALTIRITRGNEAGSAGDSHADFQAGDLLGAADIVGKHHSLRIPR